jgi:hypothetical protein
VAWVFVGSDDTTVSRTFRVGLLHDLQKLRATQIILVGHSGGAALAQTSRVSTMD